VLLPSILPHISHRSVVTKLSPELYLLIDIYVTYIKNTSVFIVVRVCVCVYECP